MVQIAYSEVALLTHFSIDIITIRKSHYDSLTNTVSIEDTEAGGW